MASSTTGPVIRRASVDDTDSVSAAVVETLDKLPSFHAAASEQPLFDSVDPDALDQLFSPPVEGDRTDGWVSFPVAEYEVRVSATGDIVVRARSE